MSASPSREGAQSRIARSRIAQRGATQSRAMQPRPMQARFAQSPAPPTRDPAPPNPPINNSPDNAPANAPANNGAPNGTANGARPNGAAANNAPPNNAPAANGFAANGTAANAAVNTAAALPARGTLRVEGNAEEMTVFAVSTDAQEVLTALAGKANLRLVVDESVSRKLTVNIVDKPARQIMEDIAGAYGLSIAEVDGVTMIAEGIPRTPSSYLLSDIDSIPTKYVDAANARNLLPVFLQDYVKVNSEQNAVVLSAPREVLSKFRRDIAQFDIPASQILIDLLLVELTDTTTDQRGLTLNFGTTGRSLLLTPGVGSSVFQAVTTLTPRFTADLRALEEKGRARVRANPRIATVSGRRATIFVGRQRYLSIPIESSGGGGGGGGGFGGGQRNFIDAGVRLGVTPYTGGQKQVLVDFDAEVSTLSALDPRTGLPEKSTRTADSIVRVNDGQTIVIGGLRQQESRDITTKVPLLGDIPLLGPLLFRTRDKRTTNTELVIFITPRILSDTGHLPAAQERAMRERFLNSDLNRPLPPSPPITMPRIPPSGASPRTAPGGALSPARP